MKTIFSTLLLFATISTEGQVKFVLTSNTNYKSIDYNKVIIYLSEDKVPKNHEDIGLVLCEGDNLPKDMVHAKKRASDYGANGLYMVKGDQNDILSSHRKTDKDKDLNVNGKRSAAYEASITFVAIRVPEYDDTVTHLSNPAEFAVDDVVYFSDEGRMVKGTIVAKNTSTAIVKRYSSKKEVPYNKLTKVK